MPWNILRGFARGPRLDSAAWSKALERSRYAQALARSDRRRLHDTAEAFLRTKSFEGAAGFVVTPYAHALVAMKASVPILNIGIRYYGGWNDVIVYPGDFRVQEEYMDDIGVVHRETRELCGQSLQQGPMVLSWQTIEEEREATDRDVVIHECAHKLDILNGDANGFPPLHRDMSANRWELTFRAAFARLRRALDEGAESVIDPYAATDPAEYFAVLSETFFTQPQWIVEEAPAVYAELAEFYRQDPLARLGARS